MENSVQRKVPCDREHRKAGQDLQYRQGQRIEILVGLRTTKATIIGPERTGKV